MIIDSRKWLSVDANIHRIAPFFTTSAVNGDNTQTTAAYPEVIDLTDDHPITNSTNGNHMYGPHLPNTNCLNQQITPLNNTTKNNITTPSTEVAANLDYTSKDFIGILAITTFNL